MTHPVARAIVKRDLRRWFGMPTGYVFITLFVFLSAAALFWPDQFFQSNLANLDTLNFWFPYLLLFFIPAVTMSIWAGEKGQGTDELLLTLPATDFQIVLGKFLAGAGIYTVALLFTFPLLVFLRILGNPDWGLLFSNYLGFWLLGLVLVGAGMVGSQLSENLTVAFIVGGLLCGLVVMAENIVGSVAPDLTRGWIGYGPVALFQEMARGIVSITSVLLFGGLIAFFLYANLALLSRRHFRTSGEGWHLSVRTLCLLVGAVALTGIGARVPKRIDTTSEHIHSLSVATRRLIAGLERPVMIQAFISPEVPRDYVQTRRTLLNLLEEYDALGGDNVRVRIVDTERYSDAAREAEKTFGIRPETRVSQEGGKIQEADVFLGLAFTSGLDEVVVPFMDRGLSVEYELTRSLRVVASSARKKVGIVDTDVKLFGGFEFQTMRQDPRWEIVRELELQYKVERVDPGSKYPEDLDVLVVALPSSLTQPEMNFLQEAVLSGVPTLLIDDPMPAFSPGMSPTDPKGGNRNPFMQNQQPPPEAKGDIRGLLRRVGIRWTYTDIVWDSYNPHPQIAGDNHEVVFVGAGSPSSAPFNPISPITSGLQEVVIIFGGNVDEATDKPEGLTFDSLMKTTPISGVTNVNEVFTADFFMGKALNPRRPHRIDQREKTLACRVRGKTSPEAEHEIDVIFLADLDMVSSQFFQIRRQGVEGFQFDNVTLLLNCVDELSGDDSYIDLRKRRPRHRTLTRIEGAEEEYQVVWSQQKEEAEAKARMQLDLAQKRLDERVAEVGRSTELDEQSKAIRIKSIRDVEQRRFEVQKAAIEDDKSQIIEDAKAQKLRSEDGVRDWYRLWALLFAPVPGILVGLATVVRRRNREASSSRV